MPIPSAFEVVDYVLYDTLSIPFGMRSADRAELFQIPLGAMAFHDPLTGAPRVKDYTETNMLQHGQLPAPSQFTVRSIRAALFARRGEIIPINSRYYRGIILDFSISHKKYWNGPLWLVVDPAVLFAGSSAVLGEFDKTERVELVRTLRHTFSENAPMIAPNQNFSVELKFDCSFEWKNVQAPGSLVVLLEGELSRVTM